MDDLGLGLTEPPDRLKKKIAAEDARKRLRDAAPDLLAALKEMLVWSQCRCIPTEEVAARLCSCGACGVGKIARAAIAKAEGRA